MKIVKNSKKIIANPPFYFILCVILIIACYFLIPNMNKIIYPYNLVSGFIVIFLGCYFILNSHFTLKKFNTPELFSKSYCVVKDGVYKYSRNPMYLGFLIFLIGLSLLLGNLVSFICPIFFFSIINWMFIPYEEEKMKIEIGSEYLKYKKNVRRWI